MSLSWRALALVSGLVLVCAWLVFRKVGSDYHRYGQLTTSASILETGIFFLHGVSSYAFLDSRVATIEVRQPLFVIAILLISGSIVGVLCIMGQFGWSKSVGQSVDGLKENGIYRYTRNPQLLMYFFVVLGYSLLWPSWTGAVWVGLYAAIAHLMVRTEEAHLLEQYGDAYAAYCLRTPRYIGWSGRV